MPRHGVPRVRVDAPPVESGTPHGTSCAPLRGTLRVMRTETEARAAARREPADTTGHGTTHRRETTREANRRSETVNGKADGTRDGNRNGGAPAARPRCEAGAEPSWL